MRIALGIEYDGSSFYGWQKQPGLPTIQGCLEGALAKIADEPIDIYCAGRTDAGVHAFGQVIHFDTQAVRHQHAWLRGTSAHLPPSISIRWAQEVDSAFHARFSAVSRSYEYIIYNSPLRPAVLAKKVTGYFRPLNIESMQKAAHYWLGEHDFSSFRSTECNSKTPMRNVKKINVIRNNDYVIIEIQANAFLHHMVRNMVGALTRIGAGFEQPLWAKDILAAKDRRAAAETMPPDGLYLMKVEYPVQYQFPIVAKNPIILCDIFQD